MVGMMGVRMRFKAGNKNKGEHGQTHSYKK